MIQKMFLSLFTILFVGVLLTGCDYSVTDPGNSSQPFDDQRNVFIDGDSFSGELFISFTSSQMLAKVNGIQTTYPLFYGSEGLFYYKIITDGEQVLVEGNLTTNNDTARTTLTMPKFMGQQTLKLLIGIKKDLNSNPIYTLLPEGVTVAMILNGTKITLIHHEWYEPNNGKPAYIFTVGPDKCNCGIWIMQGGYNRNLVIDGGMFADPYSKWTHDLQLIHASLPHNTITHPNWNPYLQCNDPEYNPYLISNLSNWQAVPTNDNQFTGADGVVYYESYLYLVLPETPSNDDILYNFVGNIPPTVTSIGRTVRNSRQVTRTATNSFQSVHAIATGQGLTMLKFGVQNSTIVQQPENISY